MKRIIRVCSYYVLSALVVFSLALNPTKAQAGDGGHGDAQKASPFPMILTIVGIGTITIGVAKVMSQDYSGYAWIAGGIAEIIGASIAGANNAKTAAETRSLDGYTFSPNIPGGEPGSFPGLPPGQTLPDICQPPGCNCSGPNCNSPQITIPNLADLKGQIENGYKNNPGAFPPGFSLDDALSKLDNEYGKAQEAVDAFNTASAAGALSGNSMLADGGDLQKVKDPSDLTSGKDRLNAGKSGEGISGAGSTDMGEAKDWFGNKLGAHAATKREAVRAVNRHGLTLEDARTGRLLTIFERVTRAIRADRDRDITLAKIEWARKEIAKKNKLKNNTVATTQAVISSDRK